MSELSHAYVDLCPQLLGDATEQMSLSLGQTLAGLLNATFGNAVEIIVGITALLRGEVRIVQTSVSTRPELRVSHAHHARADAWLDSIEYSFGSGLFLPCWYVSRSGADVHSLHRSHIGGVYNHESEFRVTAAQTFVFSFFSPHRFFS